MTPNKTTLSKEEETAKEVEKINSIRLIAHWMGFSPDCRPYKPSTPEISFGDVGIKVIVDVPLTKDLIDNANVISMGQLSNQGTPDPIFTPLGMRYIIDLFEAVMQNGKSEPEESAKVDDEDWGDDEPVKETKKSSDDEWEDEAKPSKDEEDEEWKEDWEE